MMANNVDTHNFIDCTPVGALCAWAMSRVLSPTDCGKGQQYWRQAISIARDLGETYPDGAMPALFNAYPVLEEAYLDGYAHSRFGRAYNDDFHGEGCEIKEPPNDIHYAADELNLSDFYFPMLGGIDAGDAENSVFDSHTPHCTTPRCIEAIEKHGDRHLVHACGSYRHPGWLPDAIAECERCGGHTNGTVWKHVCRICASEVPPGALQGLFVPHRCASCQARAEAEAEATNDRCGICRELRIRCCC